MAIQMRRGARADLNKGNLKAGEIVLATSETEGDYVGIAKAPNNVIQLMTETDLLNAKSDIVEEIVEDLPSELGFEIINGDLWADSGASS